MIFGSFNVYIEAPDNTIGDRIVLDTARLGALQAYMYSCTLYGTYIGV